MPSKPQGGVALAEVCETETFDCINLVYETSNFKIKINPFNE